jgi:hypothetical protein
MTGVIVGREFTFIAHQLEDIVLRIGTLEPRRQRCARHHET